MEEKETKQKNINFKQKTKENKKIKDKNENIMEEYTKEIKEETKQNIIQKQPDNKAKDTLEKDVETYDNNVKSKKKNIKIVNTYENLKKKAKKLNNKISAKININKIISKIDEKLEINKLKFNTLEMILLIIVAFVFGILISESFIYANLKQDKKETEQNITDIENIYNTIINEYYEDLDKSNLKEAAINAKKELTNILKVLGEISCQFSSFYPVKLFFRKGSKMEEFSDIQKQKEFTTHILSFCCLFYCDNFCGTTK